MIKEAKSFRNKWTAAVKAQRRRLNSLTKGLFTDAASHDDIEAGRCECPPRIVDSLTLEDYLQLQDDLQSLSVQDEHYDMLRYAADQQLLLNTCCSPTPQLTGEGVENNPL